MDGPVTQGVRARALSALRGAPVSAALMAANVAVFAVTAALGAGRDETVLLRLGALERSRVWAGEPWRLLTAAFLHVGPFHLACNVVFGFLACRLVERAVGGGRLLLLYLASALGGSALSLLGQDGVAVGASGALFGVLGTVLALHLRALGSLRAFLASPATRWLAAGIGVTALAGSLLVPLDHLSHAGGLVTGAGLAWLLSRPAPAPAWPWAAAALALAALVVGAAWPRPGLTRWQRTELEASLHAALTREDVPAARALVARADAAGLATERLVYYRALLLVQEGDLEGALGAIRPLRTARDPALRAEADRVVSSVAKTLAYRAYTGDGAPRNPWRALGFMDEACAAGDAESCGNAARVRLGP
jgi:membrane associated rhomboid family serine protease